MLTGLRPVESFDGTVTPAGVAVIEWGALSYRMDAQQDMLTTPQLLCRAGLTPRFELGVVGQYRFQGQDGLLQHAHARNVGVFGKYALLQASSENGRLQGFAAALMGGATFMTERALWSAHGRLAGSLGIGPVITHMNLGVAYDNGAGVLLGAALFYPLSFGLSPVLEVSGQVHFGTPSEASVLLGLTQALFILPLQLDASVRRDLAGPAPGWTFAVGLTADLRLWTTR